MHSMNANRNGRHPERSRSSGEVRDLASRIAATPGVPFLARCLREKWGFSDKSEVEGIPRVYSAPFASPNKIIRIEMLPKSNPSYGYDTASRSSVLPMQYSSGR